MLLSWWEFLFFNSTHTLLYCLFFFFSFQCSQKISLTLSQLLEPVPLTPPIDLIPWLRLLTAPLLQHTNATSSSHCPLLIRMYVWYSINNVHHYSSPSTPSPLWNCAGNSSSSTCSKNTRSNVLSKNRRLSGPASWTSGGSKRERGLGIFFIVLSGNKLKSVMSFLA